MRREPATRRVALYGGSFDPPHICHLLAAQWALAMLPVDELWMLPVWKHAFDKPLTDFDARLAMCRALCTSLGPRARARDWERRAGTTYTVDLLRYLCDRFPRHQWYLLVGGDVMASRERWRQWQVVESLAQVVAIGRSGVSNASEFSLALPEVSSSELRAELAEGGDRLVRAWVTPAVRRVIARRRLYGAPAHG